MNCLKIEYSSIVGDEVRIHKILDKNTMKRIDTSKALQLPYKDLDKSKDKRWNAKKINAEMLSAIQSGENIESMSERLIKVEKMNEVSAIRAARTMTTSFENLGRLDGMRAMQEDGTIIKKQWLATNDTKTRDAHAELNGVTAEIEEPFENSEGKIMYPGDPAADAANVYNCRCTLTFVVEGFEPTLSKGTVKITNDEDNLINVTQEKVFQKFEKRYANSAVEHVMLIDNKGNIMFETTGNKSRTEVPDNIMHKAYAFTHNHPDNKETIFSEQDLAEFAYNDNIKIMRVVSPNNSVIEISKTTNFNHRDFYRSYIKFNDYARNKILRRTNPSNPVEKDWLDYINASHNFLKKNAKKYGYTYAIKNI